MGHMARMQSFIHVNMTVIGKHASWAIPPELVPFVTFHKLSLVMLYNAHDTNLSSFV